MADYLDISPEMIRWAIEYSGKDVSEFSNFSRLDNWLEGTHGPTERQLESFARATYVPLGQFFLSHPPHVVEPIADFRTHGDSDGAQMSANLLDCIYQAQLRQDWYRDFQLRNEAEPLDFVGSRTLDDNPLAVGNEISNMLGFSLARRREFKNADDAVFGFSALVEELGILTTFNSVVGLNNSRPLADTEFRGFSLVDDIAPAIFINARDTKAGQFFSLAHELAHVWLGESGVSNERTYSETDSKVEAWCNQVAAQILVPLKDFLHRFDPQADLLEECRRLAKFYRVSSLVTLIRATRAPGITWKMVQPIYSAEEKLLKEWAAKTKAKRKEDGKGDFYLSHPYKVGKRFLRALLSDTAGGNTLHSDAMSLVHVKKTSVLKELGTKVGVRI